MLYKKNVKYFSIILLLFLTACSSISAVRDEKQAIEIVDGYGRGASIDIPVDRIVSLAPANTEILFAIGAGDKVVGRDEFSNYPEEAVEIPSVGGPYTDISTETILSLEPDLVIGSEITPPEQIQAFEEMGLTVFVLANPLDIKDIYNNIRLLSEFVGMEEEAEALIMDMQDRISEVEALVNSVEERPLVFYELDGTDPNAPWTAGPGSYIDTLISMAGGINVGSEFDQPWVQLSAEEIIAQNPEVILLGDSIFGVTVEDVISRPGWDNLNAVLEDRVYPFNDDLVSRPGPRVVEGLEKLVRLIHPELFE